MVSGFTPKRIVGTKNTELTAADVAKNYASRYGYEQRGGGWIYGPDGGRVCRGWKAFGQLLVDAGKITGIGAPGVRITPRFAVGDRIAFTSKWNETQVEVVEGIEYDGILPMYSYTNSQGRKVRVFDDRCSHPQMLAAA